jgi:hypothetical protein
MYDNKEKLGLLGRQKHLPDKLVKVMRGRVEALRFLWFSA